METKGDEAHVNAGFERNESSGDILAKAAWSCTNLALKYVSSGIFYFVYIIFQIYFNFIYIKNADQSLGEKSTAGIIIDMNTSEHKKDTALKMDAPPSAIHETSCRIFGQVCVWVHPSIHPFSDISPPARCGLWNDWCGSPTRRCPTFRCIC